MTSTVEPIIYTMGKISVRIEDTALYIEEDCEFIM